jgi:hypothetical protein
VEPQVIEAVPVETRSADPIREFAEELDTLLCRWHGHTDLHWIATVARSFIDEEPQDGWARQRRGPQVKISMLLTDKAHPDAPESAYFPDAPPVDWSIAMDRVRPANCPPGHGASGSSE